MEDKKTQWEVDRLKETSKKHEKKLDKHDERLDELEKFKFSTTEKLITIFKNIEEIKKSNQWWSKTFIGLLLGAIFSATTSLVVWLIQR